MAQISSVFKFLKEYNELSNPVITEIDKQKWYLKLVDLPHIKEVWSIYDAMDFENEKILEVGRPVLKPCPLPDETIVPWIKGDWKNINVDKVSYHEKIVEEIKDENGNINQLEVYFNDEPERVLAFEKWIQKRDNWRTIELPRKQGLDLYNNLFKLYSDIKKESESVELILGDGRIKWKTGERIIDHPAFLQKVQLEFNPDKPSFTIKCEELKTELYTSMLRIIESINQSMLSEVLQEVENNFYHIADKSNMAGLFKRLINVIDKKGKYVEKFDSNYDGPMVFHEPILFLRKRTLGFSIFIDKILEDVENAKDPIIPDFFENMIGNYKIHQNEEIILDNWNQNGVDQDVLLTLPANNEQLKIVKYLNNYGAVLVQGPPGTGKTHTIANLIGHLLSQGNSVLVTSHTEKALTVLKEKVHKDLQNLCISLLSSSSQRKEMDSSLFEIAEKSTSLDLNESKIKIGKLIEERKRLIEQYKSKNDELIKIRSLEYKDIVYNNETIKPIDAAKFINDGRGKIDYILGETNDDTIGLPLSIEELEILYKSNADISSEEETLLSKQIPDIEEIWDVSTFISKKKEYEKLEKDLSGWNPRILLKKEISEIEINELLEKANKINAEFDAFEEFQYAIIHKVINDSVYKTFWDNIFDDFDELLTQYEEWRKIHFEDEIDLPVELIKEETLTILDEIIKSNKEIPVSGINSLIKPKWKKLRDGIRIRNKKIEKRHEYEKARFTVQYELKRKDLHNKINKLLSEISDKAKLDINDFEEKAKQNKKKVEVALNWYESVWLGLIEELKRWVVESCALDDLLTLDFSDVVQSLHENLKGIILSDIENYYKKIKYQKLQSEWQSYIDLLNQYKHLRGPFRGLISAVINKQLEDYEQNHELLEDIYNKKEIYLIRKSLLEKMRLEAPRWADDIIERRGVHGENKLPERIKDAWKWRQLTNQLERLDSYDPNAIQKEINQINKALMNNAKDLAYEKAWYEKVKNTTSAQTQAIEGWRQTMKQIGKGTGKSAPRLMQKARELMPLCQSAIPVWIMPLNRVAENFDPSKNKFDVVIIDEASQANILALSALYLGKKVIIVGDDEQVSPDSVGIKDVEINALIEQYLQDVPNNHLFNGKTSVYDMAKTSGFKPLMLTEHFRCLPEIIEFSNQLSYNGKIKPLRDATGVTTVPAVVEYRVPNGVRTDKKINEKEAEHIASLVCACVENENYKNKTIGIISMLGEQQAYEIDKLLQVHLDPKEYEKRKVQCGTSPQFQGDERDIVFISIVESSKENGGPVTLVSEDGRNDMYRKRYNVAASRAKDQMWVVHSLNPEIDLKPEDIRLKLIKHAINPSINKFDLKLEKVESDFERRVMLTLLYKGYKVIPQYKVGAYRIDMVIEDGQNRIALECDGERYHTQDDLPNDLKRQAILERLGWKFIRIRGSAYYRNPEETMDWVYSELENYNIKPNFKEQGNDTNATNGVSDDLVVEIKRRAYEIRREWNKENDNSINELSESSENNVINITNNKMNEAHGEDGMNLENRIKEPLLYEVKFNQRPYFAADPNLKSNEEINKLKNAKSNKQVDITHKFTVETEMNDNKSTKYRFDFSKRTKVPLKNVNNKSISLIKNDSNNASDKNMKPLFDFRKKQ